MHLPKIAGGFSLPHSPPRHSRRASLRHRRQRCTVLLVAASVLVVMLLFVSLHLPSGDSLLPRGKQAASTSADPRSALQASSVTINGSQPSIRVSLATLRADPTWQQLLDPDSAVRQLSDQISLGKAYLARARDAGEKEFGDEMERGVRAAEAFLARSIAIPSQAVYKLEARAHIANMSALILQAKEMHYDIVAAMAALKEKVAKAEEKASKASAQATLASQVVSESMPKPMTCLYMRLAREWALLHPSLDTVRHPFQIHHNLPPGTPNNSRLVDTSLLHLCVFSDNVLAVSAAVNSTVLSSSDPSRLVFHVITDATSFPAFVVWFSRHPPGLASLEVRRVEGESGWLNASYAPVLRQMQEAGAKSFYFSAAAAVEGREPIKFHNPKYMALLNHLRFYLPQLFPSLHRMLFLDDDVIVQKDLSALFSLDMNGAVNGAVETCKGSFHRFHRYLNFTDTRLRGRFDPEGCAWAYGMNLFDLDGWRGANVTGTYHYWQEQNVDHSLWKLGTLPPGLLAFNGLTHAIDPSWHVLGLGYNPHLDMNAISKAAAIHWNGNQKPWLKIALPNYRSLWTKYVSFDDPWLSECGVT
ncbi:hypothetical protein CLOM_g11545 [Closterium sp. NIES-68]|nr:hypothetical protein CLOM_g20073 [Closterium sp. NIES-68]GJP52432.1 hypothetical protein CLOM_g11545 [Closterium sp. NIES-68]